jgi:hypothetical protein
MSPVGANRQFARLLAHIEAELDYTLNLNSTTFPSRNNLCFTTTDPAPGRRRSEPRHAGSFRNTRPGRGSLRRCVRGLGGGQDPLRFAFRPSNSGKPVHTCTPTRVNRRGVLGAFAARGGGVFRGAKSPLLPVSRTLCGHGCPTARIRLWCEPRSDVEPRDSLEHMSPCLALVQCSRSGGNIPHHGLYLGWACDPEVGTELQQLTRGLHLVVDDGDLDAAGV